MQQAEALQRTVWNDPTTVVYTHMLLALAQNGSPLLGAFDGDTLVGFLLGYYGLESPDADRPAMANLKLVSQRMAVLPQYRDSGIGYELKLAQRRFAIRQGIRLITWTFDPLISRNAHLNIRKLAAISQEYVRDFFGTDPSPLTTHGTSDRLLVEWWVTNNRVEQRLHSGRVGLTLPQYVDSGVTILNPAQPAPRGYIQPSATVVPPAGKLALIEIPDNITDIRDDDPDLAAAWQQQVREILEGLFAEGFIITDFVRGERDGRMRTYYVVSHREALPRPVTGT
jgi:predicted GNAT superfamily acetyltransferase